MLCTLNSEAMMRVAEMDGGLVQMSYSQQNSDQKLIDQEMHIASVTRSWANLKKLVFCLK